MDPKRGKDSQSPSPLDDTIDGTEDVSDVENKHSNTDSSSDDNTTGEDNANVSNDTGESNKENILPQMNDSERHVFQIFHAAFRLLLESTLGAMAAQLENVLDLSRLEETVVCHVSFKDHASKPLATATTGFLYTRMDGTVLPSPHPNHRGDGVRVLKDPSERNFQEGEKGILCAMFPGTTGETLDDPNVDSVLRDGMYSLKHRSQCLPLVRFPAELGTQDLRDKIQAALDQIFDNGAAPSVRPLLDSSRIQSYDILCDRNDESAPKHYGNRKFALVVSACMKRHNNLHTDEMRVRVANAIVQTVRNCEPGGRFLAKTKRGTWEDIGDNLAVRWVSLILKKKVSDASGQVGNCSCESM